MMGNIRNLQFDICQNGSFTFWSDEFHPILTGGGDFWRMFLDNGENREIGVYSSAQIPTHVKKGKDTVTIVYDGVIAEDMQRYDIPFTIYITAVDGVLHFSSDIENRDDIRVNEVQLPFIDFDTISSNTEDEILYVPDGLGRRYKNPRKFVETNFHTEYMSADYKNIWFSATYPSSAFSAAALSMPWIGIQSGANFIYVGKHDEFFRIHNFSIGTGPRDSQSKLITTIGQYIALKKGEKLHCGDSVIAVFDGDWRDGSSFYKQWSQNTWYSDVPHVDWIKDMTGWQRIILKHQHGDVHFTYSQLPEIYKHGQQYGINALLVFGWWKGCFDNHYPEYEADPALGGEEELKKAIEEIHALGGKVILYTNGNLIDVKTDYYKEIGHRICSKDIDGNDYREHYRFSNNGTTLRNFGYKSFASGCHATDEWREKLAQNAKLKLGFGADAIFYDQLCGMYKLCFDDSHPHQNRVDEEPHYRERNVDYIRSLLPEGKGIGTEGVVDRISAKMDFIHGCGAGMWYKYARAYNPDYFPDLFRHTFPECVISNRLIHDDRWDYQEHLNYAFVTGLIFDVSIYRGRAVDISAVPDYGAHVKYLLELKDKYFEFFYLGRYESACDLVLPPNVFAAKYRYKNRFIVALWNNCEEAVDINVYGQKTTVCSKSVLVVENDE